MQYYVPFNLYLKKLKFGQFVREEGPESHLKERDSNHGCRVTFCYMHHILILYLDYPDIVSVLFVTIGFPIIGFIDDYKVVRNAPWDLGLGKVIRTDFNNSHFCYYLLNRQVEVAKATEMLIPSGGNI